MFEQVNKVLNAQNKTLIDLDEMTSSKFIADFKKIILDYNFLPSGLSYNQDKPKITVLIFTYRGDEGLTPICVEFAKETLGPDTKIVAADDGFNAMYQPMQEKLISMGVDYCQTDWPRCGNLLGPDHLKGACKLMAELAKDCDIIVKLDPDACILKRDWIDRLWADKNATMTASYKIKLNYPMGNSYALKSVVCEELAKDAELYPGWVDCFEDYEVGMRISRIAKGDTKHAIRYVKCK